MVTNKLLKDLMGASMKKNSISRFVYLYSSVLLVILLVLVKNQSAYAQAEKVATEEDFYEILTIPGPADVALEVSGINLQPNGDLVLTTRFGEIWLVEDPYREGQAGPHFKRIARGLHTPLGIASKGGKFYVAQRAELTELSDKDGDGIIDRFSTYCTFDMSGNYCEYVHGPIVLPDGNFWVNMNLGHNWETLESFFGMMGNHAPWKGWAMIITPEGKQIPFASGLRSPAGMGLGSDGTKFYSENQGDWVGTGFLTTLEEGDFFGHPSSLKSAALPKSNTDLRPDDIPDRDSLMLHEAVEMIPQLKMPSVRLPHGIMGTSLSWILEDTTGGAFGPFEGQLFVADQGQSKIMRVYLEEVKGEKQGAAFQFREGFNSGIIRSSWGIDGSMFVGMSDRGWSALGTEDDGLQRLVWTGKVPFEVKAIRAKPDGFELEFTKPVDPATAGSPSSYQVNSFDYLYHKHYGSPMVDQQSDRIRGVILSDNNKRARIVLKGTMRAGYVYEITASGVQSSGAQHVLHPQAYYSLNQIPQGNPADISKIEQEPLQETVAPQGEDDQQGAVKVQKHVTKMPAEWEDGPDQILKIGTKPGLLYNVEELRVKAGSKIKLVFTNSDDMLHNLVVTTPDNATNVGKKALQMGTEGPQKGYVPEAEEVLFYTSLIQPGSSEEIYFEVPNEPGEFQYVCTYPGHYVTMRGILRVTP